MKKNVKIYIALISAIALFTGCNHDNSKPGIDKHADLDSTHGFYKRFEGTIAGQEVVLQLHKYKNNYTGLYYYRNTGGWIYVNADSTFSGSLLLSEYPEGYSENDTLHARWRCKLEKDLLTGVWSSADKKISSPINLKETYPAGSYKFTVESYSDSANAFPLKKESPAADISFSFVTSGNDWLNNRIKAIMDFDTALNFTDGYNKIRSAYFTDYKKEITGDIDSSMMQTLNFSQSGNIYVRYNDHDLVILESATYDYAGGAHGNYGSTFYCFDVSARKQLQLSDIISADSVTLQHLAEKYFKVQYHVKSDSLNEVLFENHLPANDNFYFNEKGISFLYNPYEVASYAQGEIVVFIPFSALKKYIQPAFMKRMSITF